MRKTEEWRQSCSEGLHAAYPRSQGGGEDIALLPATVAAGWVYVPGIAQFNQSGSPDGCETAGIFDREIRIRASYHRYRRKRQRTKRI